MKRKLVILDDYHQVALTSADWTRVEEDYEIEVIAEPLHGPEEIVLRLRESEIVVAMRERTPFPASILERLPRLRLLVSTGRRNSAIDIEQATQQGVVVCGTGAAPAGVPELTFALILTLARSIVLEDRTMRNGGWDQSVGLQIAGKTLGLLGVGRIGSAVARLGQAFSMETIAWSPNLTLGRAEEVGVRLVTKGELFRESDFLSVHMFLANSTRGMVGNNELAMMRPSSFLVNTARGPLVDEAALLDALSSRSIAGAGLDVFDVEPLPQSHPFRHLPNTVITSHVGYVTDQNMAVMYSDAVENVIAFREGKPIRVMN